MKVKETQISPTALTMQNCECHQSTLVPDFHYFRGLYAFISGVYNLLLLPAALLLMI